MTGLLSDMHRPEDARPVTTALRRLCAAALCALASATAAHAQQATVSGTVTEAATLRPIDGAFVSLEGTDIGTVTDEEGRYRLTAVPPGPQVLRVQRIGFAIARVSLTLPPSGAVTRDIELAGTALEMEDLTVTVDAVSRAAGELSTASVIDLQAIRQQTATSLSGVLELVPGVSLQPPGLDGIQQFSLRSATSQGGGSLVSGDLASFGTVIILDGVPLSNNANLQTLGSGSQLSFGSTAGGGIDLRRIPANTIERVEVIRGLPSARWGDLTQGAVVVDTRAGEVDPELAGQYDSRTMNGSFLWGRSFGGPGHNGTLTFDATRTRVRPGVADDESTRFAGQLSHRLAFGPVVGAEEVEEPPEPEPEDEEEEEEIPAADPGQRLIEAARARGADRKLTFDTRVDFFRLHDDRPANPNVLRINRSSTRRDWGIRAIERARLRLSGSTRLELTASYSAATQDGEASAELVRGAQPVTSRLSEGREEGFFVIGPYTAEGTTNGGPRLAYGRLELDARPTLLGAEHHLRVGIEPRREWNAGDGFQFDITRPLQSTFNGVEGFARPRSFDDVGDLVMSGHYIDDRLTLGLGGLGTLQLQTGLRLDLLHEGSSWFDGVRDVFLQPRLYGQLAPKPWLRFRGGWGRVAKAPTIGNLFPAPQYYDVVNVNQFTDDPAERLAVITTFIEDPTNEDLGWIRATKAEAGVEVGVAGAEISLVAFRDRIDDGVASDREPGFLLRDRFALTDSIIGNGVKPDIILPPTGADTIPILVNRPANVVSQINRGLELIASFPELRAIRTRLHVTGQWIETEQRRDALDFGPGGNFGDFQLLENDERAPFWDPITEFGETALLTYRVIHHQPELGLVLTGTIQHNIHDETRNVGQQDTLSFAGYITRAGDLVRVPEADRGLPQYQDLRVPRSGSLIPLRATPSDWFMSVQVSKTLPLDGQLNFWAFNLLDRRGVFNEPDIRPRVYPSIRFGLEVLLPLKGILPGGDG